MSGLGTPALATAGSGTTSTNITQVGGSSITLGQKTMANSIPVVIASDQSFLAFNEYTENTAVSGSTETTILTYTVPASKTARIKGFMGVAGPATQYKLKVDGITSSMVKSSAVQPTVGTYFEEGVIVATTGQVITITAYHTESTNHSVAAQLFGILI